MTERVIVLVDMDCFYCQVETKLNPSLAGKPVAVVQYNAWKGGGIIAVNYEARDKGVSRSMRGDDAKTCCPDIQLVSVPTIRNKADLTKYRDASRDVIAVLCTYSDCVERASIDEAYLDLTESVKQRQLSSHVKPSELSNTFVVGYSKEKCNDEAERESGTAEWLNDIYSSGLNDEASKNLAVAAGIVEEIRAEVFNKTGFRCSAGIAHNKILAKLACGLHKPNRQTVLPHSSVSHLYKTLSVKKVRHLGGKLGDMVMEKLNCRVMGDLYPYSEKELKTMFDEKTGSWLYHMARGIDSEPVTARLVPKSIGCCKRFPGKTALKTKADVSNWLTQLTEELTERILEDQSMNKRKAQLLTVSMTLPHHQATSKSFPLSSYDHDKIFNAAYLAIRKICSNAKEDTWTPIYCLGLSASKFSDLPTSGAIHSYFQANISKNTLTTSGASAKVENEIPNNVVEEKTSTSFFGKFIKKTDYETLPASSNVNIVNNFQSNESSHCISDADVNSNDSVDKLPKLDSNSGNKNSNYAGSLEPSCKSINNYDIGKSSEETKKPKNDIKGFFRKQTASTSDLKKEDLEKTPSVSTAKKKGNSIEGFFKNQNECEVINPLDVFPDLSVIDDEMLQSFPLSFRNKVLALKKEAQSTIICSSTVGTSDKCGNAEPHPAILNKTDSSSNNDCKEIDQIGETSKIKSSNKEKELKKAKVWESEDMFEDSNEEQSTNNCVNENSNDSVGKTSKSFPSNTETCPECGNKIEISELPEHMDFHVAQRINLEINSVNPSSLNAQPVRQTNAPQPAKRKQGGRGKKISESKRFKTLKTFFGS